MKHFFLSLLGALAAIWLTIMIGSVILVSVVFAVGSVNDSTPLKIEPKSILHITLEGYIEDRESPRDISAAIMNSDYSQPMALNTLIEAVRKAADDSKIQGIFLDCKGIQAGMAQIEAISEALKDFKSSGKWIYSYSDVYSQEDYIIASVADSIYLNPVGMVDIHGLQSQTPFFKSLLDKLGVEMQVVKVGTYKSAVEPFILDDMSKANREQVTLFINQIWNCFVQEIADNRSTTTAEVNKWADSSLYSLAPEKYIENNIVDHLVYRRQINEKLSELSGNKDKDPRLVDYQNYLISNPAKEPKHRHQIAVLYALGDITESEKTGIASERLVPEILDLAKNDDVEGLVLRVNSGGGSAFASEQIWEALQQFKASGKPFYVSMGDYAASGGYYISCGADKIFAEPVTLTGSIGIFGLIPDLHGLVTGKLGINVATVSTNSGTMPGILEPMTPQQRAAMQASVDRGYELFTSRCASGRNMSVDSIKAIAEGRVWDGITAKKIGLVDELGGLKSSIDALASHLGYTESEYYTKDYPEIKFEWWETIFRLSESVKADITASQLGEAKEYYDAIREFEKWDCIQARMIPVKIQ